MLMFMGEILSNSSWLPPSLDACIFQSSYGPGRPGEVGGSRVGLGELGGGAGSSGEVRGALGKSRGGPGTGLPLCLTFRKQGSFSPASQGEKVSNDLLKGPTAGELERENR